MSFEGTAEGSAPTPEDVGFTVRQKILLAAAALSVESEGGTVTTEDLVVKAWTLYPRSFSLKGHALPDSNRVFAKLSGPDGLTGLGWLERVAVGRYRLTRQGGTVLKYLRAETLRSESRRPSTPPPKPQPAAPVRSAPPPPPSPPPTQQAPRMAAPAPARPAPVRTSPEPSPVFSSLAEEDVYEAGALARADLLRKFLRGQPILFGDACAFWGFSNVSRPAVARQRVDGTESLLKRVLEALGAEGPTDPRLPPLSTCYGLFNLHRLMLDRFARELATFTAQGGSDQP